MYCETSTPTKSFWFLRRMSCSTLRGGACLTLVTLACSKRRGVKKTDREADGCFSSRVLAGTGNPLLVSDAQNPCFFPLLFPLSHPPRLHQIGSRRGYSCPQLHLRPVKTKPGGKVEVEVEEAKIRECPDESIMMNRSIPPSTPHRRPDLPASTQTEAQVSSRRIRPEVERNLKEPLCSELEALATRGPATATSTPTPSAACAALTADSAGIGAGVRADAGAGAAGATALDSASGVGTTRGGYATHSSIHFDAALAVPAGLEGYVPVAPFRRNLAADGSNNRGGARASRTDNAKGFGFAQRWSASPLYLPSRAQPALLSQLVTSDRAADTRAHLDVAGIGPTNALPLCKTMGAEMVTVGPDRVPTASGVYAEPSQPSTAAGGIVAAGGGAGAGAGIFAAGSAVLASERMLGQSFAIVSAGAGAATDGSDFSFVDLGHSVPPKRERLLGRDSEADQADGPALSARVAREIGDLDGSPRRVSNFQEVHDDECYDIIGVPMPHDIPIEHGSLQSSSGSSGNTGGGSDGSGSFQHMSASDNSVGWGRVGNGYYSIPPPARTQDPERDGNDNEGVSAAAAVSSTEAEAAATAAGWESDLDTERDVDLDRQAAPRAATGGATGAAADVWMPEAGTGGGAAGGMSAAGGLVSSGPVFDESSDEDSPTGGELYGRGTNNDDTIDGRDYVFVSRGLDEEDGHSA
eukprot:TRINITY_DN13939_c0_g1_i4.p1 TRINITY_DN13939_c0_g1~~TRINITY_DN13939_c0_g1_i4.p1  ORF type:complete len:695 (-),score=15.89 TRINITY_DN13939_c0_g1_i4:248-2332(-)